MKYLYAWRNISVPASSITLLSCYIFRQQDLSLVVLSFLFWMKIITTALISLYIHIFSDHVIVFFMNLGIGRQMFYATIIVIDMMLFFLLMTLTFMIFS